MINLFITGIDYNVGKTFITAGLATTMQSLNYDTSVYKPIQCGAVEKNGFMQAPDLVFLKTIDPYIKTYSSYMFKAQTFPSVAAEMENVVVDKNLIKHEFKNISQEHDCNLVECSGGLMIPIAPNFLVSDMVKTLDLPVIIVIRPSQNALNQTLLTINHAESKGIKVRGIIINDFKGATKDVSVKSLPRLIEEYSDAKVLGVIKHFENIKTVNPNDLIMSVLNGIDVEGVFDVKIPKLDIV